MALGSEVFQSSRNSPTGQSMTLAQIYGAGSIWGGGGDRVVESKMGKSVFLNLLVSGKGLFISFEVMLQKMLQPVLQTFMQTGKSLRPPPSKT